MAAVNYQVLNIDLATIRTDAEVLGAGSVYDGVFVLAVPAGAGVSIKLGANKQAIPIEGPIGFAFKDGCDNPYGVDEGLFVTNPAGAGFLRLFVSVSLGGGVT